MVQASLDGPGSQPVRSWTSKPPASSKSPVPYAEANIYNLLALPMPFWNTFEVLLAHFPVSVHCQNMFWSGNKAIAPKVPPKALKEPYPKIESLWESIFWTLCGNIFYVLVTKWYLSQYLSCSVQPNVQCLQPGIRTWTGQCLRPTCQMQKWLVASGSRSPPGPEAKMYNFLAL